MAYLDQKLRQKARDHYRSGLVDWKHEKNLSDYTVSIGVGTGIGEISFGASARSYTMACRNATQHPCFRRGSVQYTLEGAYFIGDQPEISFGLAYA